MLRHTTHAGSFYPRFAQPIIDQFHQWTLDAKHAPVVERSIGIIVPHAGYMYSGQCAALAYHHISKETYDALIILHPCHHAAHFDFSVSAYQEYETPLGNIALDMECYQALTGDTATKELELRLHSAEHSMEIQLPLIKHFFPDVPVCPVMIGRQNPKTSLSLADKLFDLLQNTHRRIGIVVSTDLSHYHSAGNAEIMDTRLKKRVEALDAEGLWNDIRSGNCEACGIGGVLTLIYLAHLLGNAKCSTICYTHSGKVSGQDSQVVGYLAAKVYR